MDAVLELAAKQPGRRVSAYRKEVRTRLVEGADPDKLDAVRDRVAIGSAAFVAGVKGGLAHIGRETEIKRALRRRIGFEEIVHALEKVTGEEWESIRHRHGDRRKWLLLRLARRYTGMTLAELGQAAAGMDYAAVGMGLKRLEAKLPARPDLQNLEAGIADMLDVET